MTAEIDAKIRTIIVDDERLAIKGIELLLVDHPGIEIVGTAGTIDDAVKLVERHDPDLIFLDIQLQGETGFDLFERTQVSTKIIFVTAYDAFAVRAFEINALDYLLKPVARERFNLAMERVQKRNDVNCDRRKQLSYDDVVALNAGRRMRFVKLDRILSICAEGDYTRVCLNGVEDELVLKPLKAWETILPRDHFARIHRSTIVNMEHVHKLEKTTSNRYLVYLPNHPTPLPMSQRYSARLRKKLGCKVNKISCL